MTAIPLSSGRDRLSRSLAGFGPVGLSALLVILLFGPGWFKGLLVLAWAKLSETPLRELGFVRPKSWTITLLAGVALGVVYKIAMKTFVMPLLGAPAINQAYHYLAANKEAMLGMLFTLTISAGFGEETVFRGFLFERLRNLLGHGRGATIGIVAITTTTFALAHYIDQGWPGVEQAFFTGPLFAILFISGRNLWLPIITHAAFDLTALAMIYWELESRIAHLIFK